MVRKKTVFRTLAKKRGREALVVHCIGGSYLEMQQINPEG